MINALIIEDEAPAAIRLEKMLKQVDPTVYVVGRLDSVSASVKWFSENSQPDLLFLDIQLGDGLSFDIFSKVKVTCFVIFTTAYDEYAIKAFELNSIDYLLKPIDREKLTKSLEKFRELRQKTVQFDVQELISTLGSRGKEYKKRFAISIGSKIRTVETTDIACFRSEDKNTFLRMFDGHEYPVDFSLDRAEELIDPEIFFRVNRQYIVHYRAIAKISILSKSRLELTITGMEAHIPVSSGRAHSFRQWIDK